MIAGFGIWFSHWIIATPFPFCSDWDSTESTESPTHRWCIGPTASEDMATGAWHVNDQYWDENWRLRFYDILENQLKSILDKMVAVETAGGNWTHVPVNFSPLPKTWGVLWGSYFSTGTRPWPHRFSRNLETLNLDQTASWGLCRCNFVSKSRSFFSGLTLTEIKLHNMFSAALLTFDLFETCVFLGHWDLRPLECRGQTVPRAWTASTPLQIE